MNRAAALAPSGKLGASCKQVIFHTVRGHLSHWHEAFFPAFAAHPDETGRGVHVPEVQGHHFAGTQAGAVEEFQHGGIPLAQRRVPVGRPEKALNLFPAQDVRKHVLFLRWGDLLRGIVDQNTLFAQKTIQGLDGDQFPGGRACRNAQFPALREIARNVVGRQAQKGREIFLPDEIPETVQVREVGGQGVARKAFFDDEVLLQSVEMLIE